MSSLTALADSLTVPPQGARLEWGTVSSVNPLLVQLSGVSEAALVSLKGEEAAFLDSGDKVLLMRQGQAGWVYVDRIVDVILRTEPDVPITALQPVPDDTPGAPPVDPATGALRPFVRLNAPGNVAVANLVFDRMQVSWTYTPSTNPNAPAAAGFEVRVLDATTNAQVQVEYTSSAAIRQVTIGGLEGRSYIPEVRTITTIEAITPQYRALLSALQVGLSAAFSDWARGATTATRTPPVSPVRAPSRPRWNQRLDLGLGFAWSYRPRPGDETAVRFQAKLCQNSTGDLNCITSSIPAPGGGTAQEEIQATFRNLNSYDRYWGFVRTVGSSGATSHWVSLPPRRTNRSTRPEIRNFTIRRAAATSPDIVWSAEVRRATQFKVTNSLQISRPELGLETDVGPPLVAEGDWADITGGPNRMGWYTVSGREANRYVGRGTYTVQLTARNTYRQAQSAATLQVRALPLFVYQTLVQVGNRGATFLVSGLLTITGGVAVKAFATTALQASKFFVQALGGLWSAIRGAGYSVAGATFHTARAIPRIAQAGPGFGRAAATVYQARSGATAGTVVPTLFSGLRIEVETSYIGWETLEWQVGIRHQPSPTFTTDFSGTETNPHDLRPGYPFFWYTLVSLVNFNNLLRARYFAPGVEIRLRTRATNSLGTTPWTSTFYSPNDFVFLSRAITGVAPN